MTRVAVLATLDTKGEQASFVGERLRAADVTPILVDLSLRSGASLVADIGHDALLAEARERGFDQSDKTAVMSAIADVASRRVAELVADGELDGVIGLGGGQGTWLCATVMRALSLGLPKVLVTTIPQRAPLHIGASDIVVVPSVTDISGLNRILRQVLSSAAAAVAAMAKVATSTTSTDDVAIVGLTMFGVTTPGTEAVRTRLEEHGFEVAVFHANGLGGQTFETLIDQGRFVGVIDLTTTELADELVSGYATAGPTRLGAAAARGLPQVVVPGALDVINFGAPGTVPPRFAGRVFHQHTPLATLMRTNQDEYRELAATMAEKLNRASGPVVVVIPEGGFSTLDVLGGPFYDADANVAFADELEALLRPDIPVVRSTSAINDESFADLVVARFLELLPS